MRVSAHVLGFFRGDKWRPRLAVVSRFENIRRHVAKRMSLKGSVSGRGVEITRLHASYPGILPQAGYVAVRISTRFAAIMGQLKFALKCAHSIPCFSFGR